MESEAAAVSIVVLSFLLTLYYYSIFLAPIRLKFDFFTIILMLLVAKSERKKGT